jgi:hypothetical protein
MPTHKSKNNLAGLGRQIPRTLGGFGLIVGMLLNSPLFADPAVETKLLAPANAISIHVESNGRVSAVVRQGSRLAVTIDGEEGPRFDRLLAASSHPMRGRAQFPALSAQDKADHPVMFSRDGRRYGYIGLQGEEYVVIVDGREVHRAPYYTGAVAGDAQTIHFSPKGTHFWFVATHDPDGRPSGAYHVFLDGRRLPERILGGSYAVPAFSADEKRYAVATMHDVRRAENAKLIVDGKVASYFGAGPRFLPNGKLLTHALRDDRHALLLLDGKVLNPDVSIRDAVVSANNRIAAATNRGVWLDGKIIPNTEGARDVYFSPDGKRLAVVGSSGIGQEWLWLDGKRSENYQSIQPIGPAANRVFVQFSADSSLCFAIAANGGLRYPLVNGNESDGFKAVDDPVFAPRGARYGYQVTFENGQSGVVVDGKMYTSPDWRVGNVNVRPAVVPASLQFSADGARCSFVIGGRDSVLYLDGEPVALPEGLIADQWFAPGFNGTGLFGDTTRIVFSDDSRQVAFVARGNRDARHVLVDNKVVWTTELGQRLGRAFAPSGKHFFWLNREKSETRARGMDVVVYTNGRPVLAIPHDQQIYSDLQKYDGWMHVGADGALRVLSIDAEGIKRHTIKPSADFDLERAKAAGPV